MNLSTDSIQSAIDEVRKFQRKYSDENIKRFLDRMYEIGISVSKLNLGMYSPYIVFSKVVNDTANGIEEIMVMSNTGLVHVEWLTLKDEIHEADVSPILMAEFGSGWHTDETRGSQFGIVQGSLNTYGHAKDQQWHFKDFGGNWHTSDGYEPNYPLLKAEKQMVSQVKSVIEEVFKND